MDRPAVVRPISLPRGRRVLVISDIHGNLPFLKGLLRKTGFSDADILIVLGDILEKSTGSLDTLRYLMELSKTHTIHFAQGNCDATPLGFLSGKWPDEIAARYGRFWGDKCTWVSMAHLAGVSVEYISDFPAARQAICAAFPEELAFLDAMPTILTNDDYLFVHGGVPRETDLESLTAWSCMKDDDFLSQGHTFRRWVIVGHWPVCLYREDICQADPIILPQRHIVSIDGGCTLKEDGQLNALILPEEPGGAFTCVSYDDLPTATALADQAPSPNPLNIRWGHSRVEVLESGGEFSLCRHLETGRKIAILTDFLQEAPQGLISRDATDYRLPVRAGDTLSIIRRTGRGALVKKDGVTGWYLGPLGNS
ncbi:MAG: metallophosphoesterase [Ruminiclostridium sp.]|nr:metallophosphoesterase [Ruminiclostridium sp.]